MPSGYRKFRDTDYWVSRGGKVWSDKRGKDMKQTVANGYCYVLLTLDEKVQRFSVHRLVAEVYLYHEEMGEFASLVVHHRNHNGRDNRISNLELVNRQAHKVAHRIDREWLEHTRDWDSRKKFDAAHNNLQNIA